MNRAAVKKNLMRAFNVVAFAALTAPFVGLGYYGFYKPSQLDGAMEQKLSSPACYTAWRTSSAETITACNKADVAVISELKQEKGKNEYIALPFMILSIFASVSKELTNRLKNKLDKKLTDWETLPAAEETAPPEKPVSVALPKDTLAPKTLDFRRKGPS